MKLSLVRIPAGLAPITDESVSAIKKLAIGEEILVDFTKHRNVKNHRRLFSMLQMVIDNTEKYQRVENLLDELKLRTGHFTTYVSDRGEKRYIPESINFASMGEDEFQRFFSQSIDVLLTFLPEELVNEIISYA